MESVFLLSGGFLRSFARQSWRIFANKYEIFKKSAVIFIQYPAIHILCIKHGMDASERIKKIQYPMLADPTGRLARDFDVMIEEEGIAERGDFIVNPEGVIVAYEVTAGNVGRNAEEIFRRVQASQFVAEHGDEVCPAKWQPGAETLKPSLDSGGIAVMEKFYDAVIVGGRALPDWLQPFILAGRSTGCWSSKKKKSAVRLRLLRKLSIIRVSQKQTGRN